jgi:predicted transcriptional regulator
MRIHTTVTYTVNQLAARRETLGMSRKQIAELINVPTFVVGGVEDGNLDPTASLLLEYARLVDMDLSMKLTPS